MIVALIGYGEVGRILAEDLHARSVAVSAYDLKLDGDRGQPLREHAAACDVADPAGGQRIGGLCPRRGVDRRRVCPVCGRAPVGESRLHCGK